MSERAPDDRAPEACPSCGGNGTVHYTMAAVTECRTCGGSGLQPRPIPDAAALGAQLAEAQKTIRAVAAALLEPVDLPAGMMPLRERLVGRVAELVCERTDARSLAHELAVDLDRVARECHEAALAEAERAEAVAAAHGLERDATATGARLAAAAIAARLGLAGAPQLDRRDAEVATLRERVEALGMAQTFDVGNGVAVWRGPTLGGEAWGVGYQVVPDPLHPRTFEQALSEAAERAADPERVAALRRALTQETNDA